jgi:hypothetical protein
MFSSASYAGAPPLDWRAGNSHWHSNIFRKPFDVAEIAVNFITLMNPTKDNDLPDDYRARHQLSFLRKFYSTNLRGVQGEISTLLNRPVNSPVHVAMGAVTFLIRRDNRIETQTRLLNGLFLSGQGGHKVGELGIVEHNTLVRNKTFNRLIFYNSGIPIANAHSESAIKEYFIELYFDEIPIPVQQEHIKAIIIHIQNIFPTCLFCYHKLTKVLYKALKIPVYVCVGHLDNNRECKMDVYSRGTALEEFDDEEDEDEDEDEDDEERTASLISDDSGSEEDEEDEENE